jgi:hypothetical protein
MSRVWDAIIPLVEPLPREDGYGLILAQFESRSHFSLTVLCSVPSVTLGSQWEKCRGSFHVHEFAIGAGGSMRLTATERVEVTSYGETGFGAFWSRLKKRTSRGWASRIFPCSMRPTGRSVAAGRI